MVFSVRNLICCSVRFFDKRSLRFYSALRFPFRSASSSIQRQARQERKSKQVYEMVFLYLLPASSLHYRACKALVVI